MFYVSFIDDFFLGVFHRHLQAVMAYLLVTVKQKERDRSAAFIAIGFVAVAVETDIKPHLPKIMEVVRASMVVKETGSGKRRLEPSLFGCITLLGEKLVCQASLVYVDLSTTSIFRIFRTNLF